jgi:hypothetical protein
MGVKLGLTQLERTQGEGFEKEILLRRIRRCADKSLAFPFSYFLIFSTTKRIFLEWIKEVITTKS